ASLGLLLSPPIFFYIYFFFTDTSTTEIYTLSLHDALPIFATPLYIPIDCSTSPLGKESTSFFNVETDADTSQLTSFPLNNCAASPTSKPLLAIVPAFSKKPSNPNSLTTSLCVIRSCVRL